MKITSLSVVAEFLKGPISAPPLQCPFYISSFPPWMGGSTVLDLTGKLDYLPFWVLTSCLRAQIELLRRLSFERGKWLL